jgi:hypothetical protein
MKYLDLGEAISMSRPDIDAPKSSLPWGPSEFPLNLSCDKDGGVIARKLLTRTHDRRDHHQVDAVEIGSVEVQVSSV